jgi:hypothetical protein
MKNFENLNKFLLKFRQSIKKYSDFLKTNYDNNLLNVFVYLF